MTVNLGSFLYDYNREQWYKQNFYSRQSHKDLFLPRVMKNELINLRVYSRLIRFVAMKPFDPSQFFTHWLKNVICVLRVKIKGWLHAPLQDIDLMHGNWRHIDSDVAEKVNLKDVDAPAIKTWWGKWHSFLDWSPLLIFC